MSDQEQEKNTRERIIDAAIDLFSQKGYTETTMREIAKAVGIRASSLYNHYACKEELLETVLQLYSSYSYNQIDHSLDEKLKSLEPTADALTSLLFFRFPTEVADRYIKILKIICHEYIRNKKVQHYLRYGMIEPNYHKIRFVFDSLIAQGKIAPCNTDYIASAAFSVLLAYTMLGTMDMSYMAESSNQTMFDVLRGIIAGVLQQQN